MIGLGLGIGLGKGTAALGVASFDPKSIPGLAVWYDTSLLTQNSGDPIFSIDDLSGNNNYLQAQGSGLTAPTMNKGPGGQSVYFDGTDDFLYTNNKLTGTAGQPFTMYLVSEMQATTGGTPIGVWGGQQSFSINFNSNTTYAFYINDMVTGVYQLNPTFHDDLATPHIKTFSYGSGAGNNHLVAALDGVVDSATASGGTGVLADTNNPLGLGNTVSFSHAPNGSYAIMNFMECLIYAAILAPSDDANVLAYLKAKWGTP